MATLRTTTPRESALGRLRLIALALPVGLTIGFEIFRAAVLDAAMAPLTSHLVAAGLTVLGVLLFSFTVFAIIERGQRRIVEQNLELAALSAVSATVGQSQQVEPGLTQALDRLLAACAGDAVELRVWERDGRRLAPWFQTAPESGCGQDLAQLTTALVEATPSAAVVPRFIADLRADPRFAATPAATDHLRSLASLPLTVGERPLGLITIGARQVGALGPAAQPFLSSFAGQLGAVLENRRLFQELEQCEREARALYEIATKVLASLDVDQVLESVVEHTRALLGVEMVTICVMDEQRRGLAPARRSGPSEAYWPQRAPATGENGHRRADLPLRSTTVGAKPFCHALQDGYCQCHAMAALRIGHEVIGEICVGGATPRQFSERELALLAAMANQAAIALSNARLYEKGQHTAILEERDRIAREMHDSLAQVLGYIAMQTRAIRQRLTPEGVAACQRDLEEIAKVAEEAFVDVREAILGLRESIAPGTGLTATLAQYLQKYTRQSGITARLALKDGAAPRFSPTVEVQLVRIVQEALTNVRKHAEASCVWVRLEVEGGLAQIVIEDDGHGFEPADRANPAVQGFGLQTMTERAERVGGALAIDSAPGHGCRITVRLPVGPEEASDDADTRTARGRPSAVPEGPPGAVRGTV